MKRVIILIIISLFLIGFISATGITASAIENEDDDSENSNKLTNNQIKSIITARNRIQNQYQNQSECPEDCECSDSITKCRLANGEREMTIAAGSSGNRIVQVKGINASTRVQLYKSENKVYGVFKDNETREIKIFPDKINEKIRERIQSRLENQNIELDEDGLYQIRAEKKARLFSIFPVKANIQAEISSETGEVVKIKQPWWDFLAKDEEIEE